MSDLLKKFVITNVRNSSIAGDDSTYFTLWIYDSSRCVLRDAGTCRVEGLDATFEACFEVAQRRYEFIMGIEGDSE